VFLFEIKLAIQTMKSAKKWRRQNATNGSDGAFLGSNGRC
jgi:hypothetical protein